MSWGHGAVQREVIAQLRRQRRAIDAISLVTGICDGHHYTYSQEQSARRALRTLAAEGVVVRSTGSRGLVLWAIALRR